MVSVFVVTALLVFVGVIVRLYILDALFLSRLGCIPGPKVYASTRWRLAWDDWQGSRTRIIDTLHNRYGPVVRIGPNEIHFNSVSALRTIYGAGSGFERTFFYRMFDAYGHQNLFTFKSVQSHGERKKLVAHEYSKSVVHRGPAAAIIEENVGNYLALIASNLKERHEIFTSLHYFSIDTITHFLYGPSLGGTYAVEGRESHRELLSDVIDPARRKLSWFAVHLPKFTKWLYTQTGFKEMILTPWLPMKKPSTYTGIRAHALKAWYQFIKATGDNSATLCSQNTVIAELFKHHNSNKRNGLSDMDIASECADHLLAGIDTTADSLMFLIWALSLPKNAKYQQKLTAEVRAIPTSSLNSAGIPRVHACDKLVYLDAVIKETLRLYAPLPASEPRSLPKATTIDGYHIPAGTIVNVAPYSMHRNAQVFENPLQFDPERWLGDVPNVAEMKKWFNAFSTGGRGCIGVHLAMAEMTTLVAALYRIYSTSVTAGYEDKTPAITSRFELFYDETMPRMEEHTCYIDFHKT